jgi:hypothetical protein
VACPEGMTSPPGSTAESACVVAPRAGERGSSSQHVCPSCMCLVHCS